MSRRPDGRRGRRKPDPAEETASWLLEIEQAAQADDEEDDWSGTLRATRREATGQFPPVPSGGPAGAGPPSGPPTTPRAGWSRPSAAEPPAGHQQAWFAERGGQAPGHDTGGWGGPPAEPPPQEPQAWDTQANGESWNGRWPFEETSQSWKPDDRSYTWPAQELPANTGGWEPEPAPGPSEDPWGSPQRQDSAGPPGYREAGYQAAAPQAGAYGGPGYGNNDPGYGADPGYAGAPEYGTDPGGYAPPSSGYPSGAYEPAGGAYPPTAGYPATGYQPSGQQTSNGYDGTGEYPRTGEYQAGGHTSTEGYPATGGYSPPAGGDPYSTGGQYPAQDPYAASPSYGGADGAGSAGPRPDGSGDAAEQEPYPGHDPFAAYGLQSSRRHHGASDGTPSSPGYANPNQPSFGTGPTTGPIGAGRATGEIWPPVSPTAARAAASPPRPDTWPAQTGTWGIEEAPPRPRSASSGELSSAVGSDEGQVVRLGRPRDDLADGLVDRGPRVHTGRGDRFGGARPLDDGDHVSQRARWPRVVALISWIILLMVLCWFYVFPWLEKILPENF